MTIEAQVALVHGGGIRPIDGGGFALRPGSINRAEAGIALYYDGVVEKLLFSGGNAHGHDFPQSEGSMMADLALQAEVPASCIERETTSTSTVGNWANSLPLLAQMDAKTVLGVTGRVAGPRAAAIGERLINQAGGGLSLVGYRSSGEREGLRAYPREAASRWMARRCLDSAETVGVPLADLDTYYLDWKSRTGLAHAKAYLTRR